MVSSQETGSISTNLSLRLVEESHIGRRKKEQQDFHGHVYIPAENGVAAACLFVVADGVSMGSAGALASSVTVETLLNDFKQLYLQEKVEPVAALNIAFSKANLAVHNLAQDRPGMATTCCAALVVGNQLVTTHVGDSRIYFERVSIGLLPVTMDHSWSEEVGRTLVRQGELTPAQLAKDNRRHAITRAMGLSEVVKPDFNYAQLEPGDVIALCSDGLWDMLEPEKFEEILTGGTAQIRLFPPEMEQEKLAELSHRLVNEALAAGGRDNITLILVLINAVGNPVSMPSLGKLLDETAADVEERLNGAHAYDYADPYADMQPTPPASVPMMLDAPSGGLPYQPMGFQVAPPLKPKSEPVYDPETDQATLKKVDLEADQSTSKATAPEPEPVVEEGADMTTMRSFAEIGFAPGEVPASSEQSEPAPIRLVTPPEVVLSKAQQLVALGNWEEGIEELIKMEVGNPGLHGLFEVNKSLFVRYLSENIARGEKGLQNAQKLCKRLKEAGIERYNSAFFDECLVETKQAAEDRNYALANQYAQFALSIYPSDNRARLLQELNEQYLELKKPGLNAAEKLSIAQRLYARDPDFGAIQDDLAAIYMELGDEAAKDKHEEEAISWYYLISPLHPNDTRLVSLASYKQRAIEDDRKRRGLEPRPQPTAATTPPKRPAQTSQLDQLRPESEVVTRLKERVSRAQKSWDSGRKEVGAEYIDLVDQLNTALNPNPWQPTFPRVCYDYGKWLFDQKQYKEARPYFVKAHELGMPAAQQRISEIDRAEKEAPAPKRGSKPTPIANDDFAVAATPTPPTPAPPSAARDWASEGFFGKGDSKATAAPSAPTNFAIPTPAPISTPPLTSAPLGGSYTPPRNNFMKESSTFVKSDKADKPERLVGVSGTLRNPLPQQGDPLQSAASREATRLGAVPIPPNNRGSDNPYLPIKQRNPMPGWILPLLFGFVIIVALGFVIFNMLNQGTKDATVLPTSNATITITPSASAVSPSPVNLAGQISAKVSGLKADDAQVFLAVAGEPSGSWRELKNEGDNLWTLSGAAINRLDPTLKYAVIVRPKDTANRKYQADVPLNAPIQTLFARADLTFNPLTGLSVELNLAPQALNFYPLGNGTSDQLVANGRYIGATRHIITTDFFKYYSELGDIRRLGYPISEEFDLDGMGRVQFYERGWLVQNPTDKLVKLGRLSADTINLPPTCAFIPKPPTATVSGAKADAAFAAFVQQTPNVGAALSPAFEVKEGNGTKKVQYFEFARLETNADGKPGVNLGLLGTEYARCKDWFRT